MARDLRQANKIGADHFCVLIAIAAADLPAGQDASIDRQLGAFGARLADHDFLRDVRRISGGRIAAIKLEQRCGDAEVGSDVPFGADFVAGEFFGRQILLGRGQCQELVAGAGQEGFAVAGIDRGVFLRLEDQAKARAGAVVIARKGPRRGRDQIGAGDPEPVMAQTNDQFDMLTQTELILHIGGDKLDL